mgnify:CR=1 FL=1
MEKDVINFIKKQGATTLGELSSQFKISKRQANYIVTDLLLKGKIKRIGEIYVIRKS